MIDDAEPWQFSSQERRKARIAHPCGECKRTIQPGETYEYTFGKFEDEVFYHKMCSHCVAAARWLVIQCQGYCQTYVLQELIDHWGENTSLRSFWLGRAIVGMKRAWTFSDGKLMPVLGEPPVGEDETEATPNHTYR
jgi:hypothetical protein